MKIYAFDVDHTLEISGGPVTFASIVQLKQQGDIVGLCGNFAAVTLNTRGWENLFSFFGPMGTPKEIMLANMKQYVLAEEHILVGNIAGVSGTSDDKGAAERSGWRFIQEKIFAEGAR